MEDYRSFRSLSLGCLECRECRSIEPFVEFFFKHNGYVCEVNVRVLKRRGGV